MTGGKKPQREILNEPDHILHSSEESPWIAELQNDHQALNSDLQVPASKYGDNDTSRWDMRYDTEQLYGKLERAGDSFDDYEKKRERAEEMGREYGFDPINYERRDQTDSVDGSDRVSNPLPSKEPVADIAARAGMDPETVERARRELVDQGVTPESLLPNLMKHNRVLALGEGHSYNEPQEKMLTSVMADLKASGATHLAVELQDDQQPALDEFMRTGVFPDSLPSHVLTNPVYMDTLRAARDAGLKLVAVDMPHGQNETRPERDPYMAHKIDEVLSQSPDNKVVFLVGERHIDDFTPPDGTPQKQPHTAVEYLRDKYDVASVGYQRTGDIETGLGRAFSDLATPAAVSTSRAETIAGYKQYQHSYPYSYYDYEIFYPDKGR
ncbi:MAG: hypothetical protein AB7W16_08100 [Candidatus Obscuribacterales bacterium]